MTREKARAITKKIEDELIRFSNNGEDTEENIVLSPFDVIERVLMEEA